ncbi:hypothetical protein [Streptomyces poriticola]|uniref:hypothetical protein n=1 Tax=Streptomyces poriticola TaxID=3120506 RepID=UPI002FCE496C
MARAGGLPDPAPCDIGAAEVTEPFTGTLPGIVHRNDQGDRLRCVIAASDGRRRTGADPPRRP